MNKPRMPKVKWFSFRRLGQVHKAKDGWRWRIWSKNGRIIAESGEAYRSKQRCTDMLVDLTCGFGCQFFIDGVTVDE